MLNNEIKKQFLEELAKDGIIASACRKSGLNRMTFYRLRDNDPSFRKRVKDAMKVGRENGNDMADFSLLQLIREKNLGAIKWYQVHGNPKYRPKPRRILFEHSRIGQDKDEFEAMKREHWNQITDAMKDVTEMVRHQQAFTEEAAEKIIESLPDVDITDIEDSNPAGT